MSWAPFALGLFSPSLVYASPFLVYAVRTLVHLCTKAVRHACVGILSVLRLRRQDARVNVHPLCAQTVCRACMDGCPLCAQAMDKKCALSVL